MQKAFSSFDDNVKSSVITEKDNTTKFEILLTFDPSPEILICILSVSGHILQKINTLYEKASIEVEGKHFDLDILMGGDMIFLQLVFGLGGSLCHYSCPWLTIKLNYLHDHKIMLQCLLILSHILLK
jgi:hypothetical protein